MDDPDAGELPETVCRETPSNMELVPSVGGICSKQRYQHGYGLQSILSQLWRPPLSAFSFHAQQGYVKPSGSCANDGGPNEDRPGGSSGSSHRRLESGQIPSGPLEAR